MCGEVDTKELRGHNVGFVRIAAVRGSLTTLKFDVCFQIF
jgi:hypothetical protein